jgi:hypothetical protein
MIEMAVAGVLERGVTVTDSPASFSNVRPTRVTSNPL